MHRRRVLVVIGTRPEAIKLAPVVLALRAKRFRPVVCLTGQHRDLVKPVLSRFGIKPAIDLKLMRDDQALHDLASRAIRALQRAIAIAKPDCVVVQGDTMTTFAAAFAAFLSGVPVAHVEAGLRSGNKRSPFPEEMSRILTSRLAEIHFAPTKLSAQNLIREGIPRAAIHVVGNTVVDALLWASRNTQSPSARRPRSINPPASNERIILVTGHRRESFGAPLFNICLALRTLADRGDVRIIYAVHPNPNIDNRVRAWLGGHPRIALVPPLDYGTFVFFLTACAFVITDSGGVQEEAPYLGKPVLVTREITERNEGIRDGSALLVGHDPLRIVRAGTRLLDDPRAYARMAQVRAPYGDGHASQRIADLIERHVRETSSWIR